MVMIPQLDCVFAAFKRVIAFRLSYRLFVFPLDYYALPYKMLDIEP